MENEERTEEEHWRHLFFFLQYTRSLSNRKKILSWMFPAEIFRRTPCMSSSVHVSVILEPCEGRERVKRFKRV